MKMISHRGNLYGPDLERENHPDYITEAIDAGYDVEIDVWYLDNEYWLGHDNPQYKTNLKFLKNRRLWCHAKNLAAMEILYKNEIHCFWHESDKRVFTSKGYIWTYPDRAVCSRSVIVCHDKNKFDKINCFGICTDYVLEEPS